MPAPVIRAANLALHFDGGATRALDGLDFQVDEGEFVAIVGPSGCGKSSLLHLIGALDVPTAGQLSYRGQPYAGLPDLARFRRERLGFVFQSFHLIPTLDALENVLVATVGSGLGERVARERARQLLEDLGVGTRAAHFPGQLSGGERQRVAIARALINGPELILADEPTGSLDSASAAQVLELLCERRQRDGVGIVMVTHDTEVARRADRRVHLRDGRLDAGAAA